MIYSIMKLPLAAKNSLVSRPEIDSRIFLGRAIQKEQELP